jgi:hypothetical protein
MLRKSFLIALTTLFISTPALAADERNWGSVGFISLGGGSVTLVEYETIVDEGTSLGLRLGLSNYSYTDGSYSESGDAVGLEATYRYYVEPVSFRGRYWGWGIGLWSTSYNWTDSGPTSGSGSTMDININAVTGWKIRMSRGSYFIDPQIGVGLHTGLGFYFGVGIQIGSRF